MKIIAILVSTFLIVGMAQAKTYRWTDPDGTVHYGDQLPPTSIKKFEEKHLGKNTIDISELPYSVQQAAKKYPVTLYVYDCGELCTNARNFLAKRGVPYTEKNPQQPAEQEAFKQLTGGGMEIPLLVVGSQTIKGYQEGDWSSALDSAGYLKNAPATKSAPAAAQPKSQPAPDAKLKSQTDAKPKGDY